MDKIANKKEKITVSFVDSYSSTDVTGSMILVKTPNYKILLDCGLHQSNDKKEDYLINSRKSKEFKAKDIDFVILSHSHGDHILMTPKLYKDGFRGATLIPEGTKAISKKMLDDCSWINTRDVELLNRQENKNYLPLYTEEDVEVMMEYTIEKKIGEKIFINDEISMMFIQSGHLLKGCQILLYLTVDNCTKVIGYTSDLGNPVVGNRYVGDFEKIKNCDILIGESTYGDRPELKIGKKERKNDLDKLKTIIDTQVVLMKGRLVIPTFAQSRSAQLINFIYNLYKNDENFTYKIYLDSPLAISILEEYGNVLSGDELKEYNKMMQWDNLVLVKESEDSKALVASKEACCVISTSGMMQIGRIRHHFKSIVSNPNATILFCGYSTPGSLASMLKDNKRKTISLDRKEYKIKCAAYNLKSMSGHAMFNQLIDYYSSVNCQKIILHHGSTEAKNYLATELKKELEKKCKSTRVIVSNPSLKFSI